MAIDKKLVEEVEQLAKTLTETLARKRPLVLAGNKEEASKRRRRDDRPDTHQVVSALVTDSTEDKRTLSLPGTSAIERKDVTQAGQDVKIGRAPTSPSIATATYDTCFGLLCIPTTTTHFIPDRCTPCTLKFSGSIVRVFVEKSNRFYTFGGPRAVLTLQCDALPRLVNEFAGTLSARICGRKKPNEKWAAKDKESFGRPCTLRVVVYGRLEAKTGVAKMLASEDLFLQHPSQDDVDQLHDIDGIPAMPVPYLNPQYFLPAGHSMPTLQELAVAPCCGSLDSADSAVSPPDQNEILRIFDTAYDSSKGRAVLQPSPRLATQLKRRRRKRKKTNNIHNSHQIEALTFMVEKETGTCDSAQFPTLWKPLETNGELIYENIITRRHATSCPPPAGGGILADEMGLGKTLSTLSLICHSLDCRDNGIDARNGPRTTLIVTPKSTIYGWENQIKTHIRAGKVRWAVYHGANRRGVDNFASNDIVLTTYDTLQSERSRQGPLVRQEWARIILDEAHKIRNTDSRIFGDVGSVCARYRWCLTGTPIQNRLADFGALLSFIRIAPFQHKDALDIYVLRRMRDGGGRGWESPSSTSEHRESGLQLLRSVVAATCLRRTKEMHAGALSLTQKDERVEPVDMDGKDRELYNFFQRFSFLAAKGKEEAAGGDGGGGSNGKTKRRPKTGKRAAAGPGRPNALTLLSMLRLVCDHGEALLPASAHSAWTSRNQGLLTLQTLDAPGIIRRCVGCERETEELDTAEAAAVEEFVCGHVLCETCSIGRGGECQADRRERSPSADLAKSCPRCGASTGASSSPAPPSQKNAAASSSSYSSKKQSAKLKALLRNLAECADPKSNTKHCWTKMLDLVAAALQEKRIAFCRIDGQSTLPQRREALELFGSAGATHRVMLATIGAAGEGIDLTAASTVHLVEPHWNPMAEAQAVDRIHRIGQTRDVVVIRYIVQNSVETYIQWVQNEKLRMIRETLSPSDKDHKKVAEERFEKLLTYLKP